MLDVFTLKSLQDIYRALRRSFLQYLVESYPWTSTENEDAVAQIHQIAVEDSRCAGRIVEFLRRRHLLPPYVSAFPMEFTSYGFIGLDHDLPLVAKLEKQATTVIAAILERLTEPEAKALVQEILAVKRRQVAALDQLATLTPTTTRR